MSVSELASFQASLSKRGGAWKKILKDPIAVVSGLIAFIIIFLVAFADFFAPQSPTKTDLKSRLQPPSLPTPWAQMVLVETNGHVCFTAAS